MQALPSLQAQQRIKLKNGRSMPLLGLGTCIGDLGDVERAVKHALGVGYRQMPTYIYIYGNPHMR